MTTIKDSGLVALSVALNNLAWIFATLAAISFSIVYFTMSDSADRRKAQMEDCVKTELVYRRPGGGLSPIYDCSNKD